MTKLPRYHSLVAWQRADDLFIRLHRVTREHFPADERYELTSQLRRAAFSVPANIVEGPPSPFGLWRDKNCAPLPQGDVAVSAYIVGVAGRDGLLSAPSPNDSATSPTRCSPISSWNCAGRRHHYLE